jgi:hypothetical protein
MAPLRAIQVVLIKIHSFYYCLALCIWMHHTLFSHSLVEGHLSCFQFGAITNKIAVISIYKLFFFYFGVLMF